MAKAELLQNIKTKEVNPFPKSSNLEWASSPALRNQIKICSDSILYFQVSLFSWYAHFPCITYSSFHPLRKSNFILRHLL